MSGPVLVVLTGGGSRRMGRDKATLVVGGAPLAARVVQALTGLADEVVLAGRAVPGVVATVVADTGPAEGPLAALAGVAGERPGRVLLVAACDAPLVTPAVCRLLLDSLAHGAEAAALGGEDGPEPLPLALAAAGAARLPTLVASGARSLRAALVALRVTTVPAASWRAVDPTGAAVRSWNSPGDVTPLPPLPI